MGACGCCELSGGERFAGPDGTTYVIEIYPSCDYCDTPAGFRLYQFNEETSEMFDIKHLKEVEFFGDPGYERADYSVVGRSALKKLIANAIVGYKPESGVIDEIDADVLSDEGLSELRACVWESKGE